MLIGFSTSLVARRHNSIMPQCASNGELANKIIVNMRDIFPGDLDVACGSDDADMKEVSI